MGKGFARVAILGAGNGACAFAAEMGMKGRDVRIFTMFPDEIGEIKKRGGVEAEGAVQGFGRVSLATTDVSEAVKDVEMIMVVVPASAHGVMAEAVAPYLRDGQVIAIHPGRTCGALEFVSVLRRIGVRARIKVAEAQTLLYTCRISSPARVAVKGIKNEVGLAAFPASDTAAVLEVLNPVFPQFKAARNVLETSMENIGAVFHPAALILNTGRVESPGEFEFYRDGMTPMVTSLMEQIDRERVAVAEAVGVETESAAAWLRKSYGTKGDTLHELLHNTQAYKGIKAPKTMDVRYAFEDIPTGLVPMASLGGLLGVETPACRALVDLACCIYRRDFWAQGRSVENLGLAGLTRRQLLEFVETGIRPGHE